VIGQVITDHPPAKYQEFAKSKVGAQHTLNAEYFRRIDALNYTMIWEYVGEPWITCAFPASASLLALHRFDRAVHRPPLRRPHRLDKVVDRGARDSLSDGRPGHLQDHGARRDAQICIRRQQGGAPRSPKISMLQDRIVAPATARCPSCVTLARLRRNGLLVANAMPLYGVAV
jgi:hypothetical protein